MTYCWCCIRDEGLLIIQLSRQDFENIVYVLLCRQCKQPFLNRFKDAELGEEVRCLRRGRWTRFTTE